MLRSLPLTMRHIPLQRQPLDPSTLLAICRVCDELGSKGTIYKCAFLLAFYGFLRQSNLAPNSSVFDVTRHTSRDDVYFLPPGLIVYLKWTKSRQAPGPAAAVPLPAIPGHPLDPVRAYRNMLACAPTPRRQAPLLFYPSGRLVTTRHLQTALRAILTALGFPAQLYSLHSLRRGGATTSVRAGADYLDVKRHGTWRSDSFWDYIASHVPESSPVAAALSEAISNVHR